MSPSRTSQRNVIYMLLAWLLAAPWATSFAADDAAPRFAGRSLEEALDMLREDGLRLFYTSKVVRTDLQVESEPPADEPIAILTDLLEPHGLLARPGPGGRLMIVEAGPTGIRGVVRDRRSAKPLAGARLDVSGGVEGLMQQHADSSGSFRLNDLSAGVYQLEAYVPGYRVQRIEGVHVTSHALTEVIFELEATLLALDEIVVTPSRLSLLSSEPVKALDLDRDEILALPHLGDDIFRAMTLLPGVSGEETSARFNVRGGRPDEVLVLLDQVELYEPYHLKDFSSSVSIVSPGNLQEVKLLTGGYPARYGDRMGGVLEMTTRQPKRRRHRLGLSILNAELSTSGFLPEDRGHWIASGRRGALDLTLEFLGQDQKPIFWDAFGKLDYGLSESQHFNVRGLTSDDRLDVSILDPDGFENVLTSYQSHYLWTAHQGIFSPRVFVDSTLYGSRVERDRIGSEVELEEGSGFDVSDRRRLDVLGLKQDWSAQSDRVFWSWGFDVRHLETRYDYENTSDLGDVLLNIRGDRRFQVSRFAESLGGESYGVHASHRWSPSDDLGLEVGLRWDRHTVTADQDFSPRFHLVYASGKASTWRLAWGHFHQSQRTYELQVEDGETQLQSSERTEQTVLGFEHTFSLGQSKAPLQVRLEAYHRQVRDPRVRFENLFEPLSEFPEIETDRVRIAPQSSRAYGVEALVKGAWGPRVDWWVSYAYARTKDRIDGRRVPRRIDQPHTLNLDLNCRLGEQWNLNLAWRYHTGWPITEVTGVLPEADDGEEPGEMDADDELDVLPVFGPLNGGRLPSYHRLDLRLSRAWELRRGDLEFFLEVQNVYDRGNLAGFDPGDSDLIVTPEGAVQLRPEEEVWGGILPSFGVTWEF